MPDHWDKKLFVTDSFWNYRDERLKVRDRSPQAGSGTLQDEWVDVVEHLAVDKMLGQEIYVPGSVPIVPCRPLLLAIRLHKPAYVTAVWAQDGAAANSQTYNCICAGWILSSAASFAQLTTGRLGNAAVVSMIQADTTAIKNNF